MKKNIKISFYPLKISIPALLKDHHINNKLIPNKKGIVQNKK